MCGERASDPDWYPSIESQRRAVGTTGAPADRSRSPQANPSHRMLAALFLCVLQVADAGSSDTLGLGYGSVDAALEGLISERSELRVRAERYLTGRLRPDDLPAVISFVSRLEGNGKPSMDAIWRLGHAIGSGGTNLPLALDLYRGGAARVSNPGLDLEPIELDTPKATGGLDNTLIAIGDHAIDELISSWRPGLDRVPVSGAALQLLLREEREREAWTPLELMDGPVVEIVDRLSRLGELPAPIVIAPQLAELLAQESALSTMGSHDESFRGPWDQILLAFAQSHSLSWEAVMSDGEFGEEIAWLRLVKRGAQGEETGHAQVRRALEDYARNRLRSASQWGSKVEVLANSMSELRLTAHFLGGIEWPASRDWLGDLWFGPASKDTLAFAALLGSAGRGQFDSRFLSPKGLERLLSYGDRIGGEDPENIALQVKLRHALARLPRLGTAGLLAPIVLEGWGTPTEVERLNSGALLTRLVALEAVGGGGPEGARRARALLESGERQASVSGVQLAALRVLAAASGIEPMERTEVANAVALTATSGNRIAPDEMGRLLSFANVRVPLEPLQLPGVPGGRPAAVRAIFAAALLEGDFARTSEILIDTFGFHKQGSWSRSLEGQGATRMFDELLASLEGAVRRGDLMVVRELISRARERADELLLGKGVAESHFDEPAALDRLELLSGAMSLANQAYLLEDLAAKGEASPLSFDPIGIAQLAASPGGIAGRSILIGQLELALQSPNVGKAAPALAAVERTLQLLWARNSDDEAMILILDTAQVAAGLSGHPLSKRILYSSWPPAIAQISRNLDLLDR